MREKADRYFVEPRGLLTLWGGFLIPPVAWVLHHQFSYLYTYHACNSGNMWLFHAGTLLLLLFAASGSFLAWRAWKDTGQRWPDEGGAVADRSRFMALGSLILGGLFVLLILAQYIPTFIVDPCIR
jgi:hypothetical protein